jgi:hypothetical protein
MNPDLSSTFRIRRSWRSLWLNVVFFYFFLGLSLLTITNPSLGVPLGGVGINMPIFLLLALVVIARPFGLMHDTAHIISPHHVRSTTGIISPHQRIIEIAYEDLLGVRVDQTIAGRILNFGDILIGAAESSEQEIVMRGVRDPMKYVAAIGARIDKARVERRVKPIEKSIEDLSVTLKANAH